MLHYFILSLIQALVFMFVGSSKNNLKLSIFATFGTFFLMLGVNYFLMPTMSLWHYSGVWIETFITSFIAIIFYFITTEDEIGNAGKLNFLRLLPLIITIIAPVVAFFQTAEMFNAEQYNKRLEVEVVDGSTFKQDIAAINVEKMITVDEELAKKVAEDVLGNDPALGSKVEIGNMTIQNFSGTFTINNGKVLSFENHPIWVAPLEHNSFYKWLVNDTTPGYVIVDATDSEKRYLITEINGEPLALRYIESGCFNDDIERHIRLNGYLKKGITDHSFEISPNGYPYWVLSCYNKTIGFGGEEVVETVTVDAITGKIEAYSVEDTPKWIDRIQPEHFVTKQIRQWGEYKLGYWNSVFKQEGVLLPTPGTTLVYSEGKTYWYTGIQTANADKSTNGFMLVDTKTKKAKFYEASSFNGGFNEEEAMRIAEGQPEQAAAGYYATFPVLYNVRGIPTYFMTYKDMSGNIQGYCFIASNQRTAVGCDKVKSVAAQKYLTMLSTNRADNLLDSSVKAVEITATVRDIRLIGETYYILLNEKPGFEFTANYMLYPEMKYTNIGSTIKIGFKEGTEELVIPIDSYDITEFEI